MSEHVSLSNSQVMLSKPLVKHTSVDFTGARTRRNSREPVTHPSQTPRALTSREWISKCLICTNNSTRTRRFPQTLSNSLVFVRIDWIKANRCVYWGDGVLSFGVIMDWTSLQTWNEKKTHTLMLYFGRSQNSRGNQRGSTSFALSIFLPQRIRSLGRTKYCELWTIAPCAATNKVIFRRRQKAKYGNIIETFANLSRWILSLFLSTCLFIAETLWFCQ